MVGWKHVTLGSLALASWYWLGLAVVDVMRKSHKPGKGISRESILASNMSSDDELYITDLRLDTTCCDNLMDRDLDRELMICMPTVARRDGVEYISNAVKSWAVMSSNSRLASRIAVFGMDTDNEIATSHKEAWVSRVFASPKNVPSAAWLTLEMRASAGTKQPRKRTHGDSDARIEWRSKEAMDYVEVLERCNELAEGRYLAIVQDDVLFTPAMADVVTTLDEIMRDNKGTTVANKERWCSASLFDISRNEIRSGGKSWYRHRVEKLETSNMVARVYARDDQTELRRFVRFVRQHFDESPIDWLADTFCRRRRSFTYVLHPNPVRHRGVVSSFADNDRTGTVT
jgi:hypothetical protein